jgi:hypothetical protein
MLDGNTEKLKLRKTDSNLQTLRALMPLVLFGYLMALFSLIVKGWPTGQFGQQNVDLVLHFERILRPLVSEGDSAALSRRILDIAFYLVLLAGFGFMVLVWRRGKRSPLLGLVGVAILGLSYASGMALFTGGFMSMCGFLLILFGGIVMLTTARDDDEEIESTELYETIAPDENVSDQAAVLTADEPGNIDTAMEQTDTTDLEQTSQDG